MHDFSANIVNNGSLKSLRCADKSLILPKLIFVGYRSGKQPFKQCFTKISLVEIKN